MLVKYQDITTKINTNICPLYIIIGQDTYLQNDIGHKIKQVWKKTDEVDEEILDIDDEWQNAFMQANSYSLFSERLLIDIRYAKKTINSNFKESILKYANNYNPKTLVIIKAPNLTYKQLDFLVSNKNILICSAQQLSLHELEMWIKKELQNFNIIAENNIHKLIAQYTQNNMLAAHQTIVKLSLTFKDVLTEDNLLKFINDQSEYPIYELTAACLQANSSHAINILRKFANNNQNTSVYILWLLSHEVQTLLQLKQMEINTESMPAAYKKLKIWPQKIKMYEVALKRFTLTELEEALKKCALLDFKLKSSTDINVWDKLEQLILILSLGRQTNDTILVNEI